MELHRAVSMTLKPSSHQAMFVKVVWPTRNQWNSASMRCHENNGDFEFWVVSGKAFWTKTHHAVEWYIWLMFWRTIGMCGTNEGWAVLDITMCVIKSFVSFTWWWKQGKKRSDRSATDGYMCRKSEREHSKGRIHCCRMSFSPQWIIDFWYKTG